VPGGRPAYVSSLLFGGLRTYYSGPKANLEERERYARCQAAAAAIMCRVINTELTTSRTDGRTPADCDT